MIVKINDNTSHEAIMLDSSHRHIDDQGYLIIYDNPIACAGVLPFLRHQISDDYTEANANETVSVFRSEQSLIDAIDMFKNKPIVHHHKWVGSNGETNQADGAIGSEVTYKDGALHADLIIYNKELIDAIQAGTCKQLSPGYNAKITKNQGIYDNKEYTHSISYLGVNHLGVVEHGRAGSKLSILDEETKMGNYNASNTTRHSKGINCNASSFAKVAKATDAKEPEKEKKTSQKTTDQGVNNLSLYKKAKEKLKRGELNDYEIMTIKKQMDVNVMAQKMTDMEKQISHLKKKQLDTQATHKRQLDAENAVMTITKYIPNWVRKPDTDADTNYRNAYHYLTKEKLPDSMDAKTAFITLCQARRNAPKEDKEVKKYSDTANSEKIEFITAYFNQRIYTQLEVNKNIKKGA